MIFLLCAAVVYASCLLSSNRKEWNTALKLKLYKEDYDVTWYVALKCSNAMPSIDTDLLTPYYSD